MTIEADFKEWLVKVYPLIQKRESFGSPNHYAAGIRRISKALGLPGEGLFNENTDLDHFKKIAEKREDLRKNLTHLKAFELFRKNRVIEESSAEMNRMFRQNAIFKKQLVETTAVKIVFEYYTNLGYDVISKERDNIGWDLEAIKDKETLLLEVKGLSGNITSIELSPNEYKHSKEKNTHYKLCIVTNALAKPTLEIFGFDTQTMHWINAENEKLVIKEMIGARFSKDTST